MRGRVFTTATVDNINHNPSSTASKQSFHGTAISLVQHHLFHGASVDRDIIILGGSNERGLKVVDYLPHYYTDDSSVTGSIKNTQVLDTNVTSLSGNSGLKQHVEREHLWLQHTQVALQEGFPLPHGLHTTQVSSPCLPVGPSAPPHYSHSSWRVPIPWLCQALHGCRQERSGTY